MKNDEIRKLLGGYATNTLTEEERRLLFQAALEDQELFNALEDEQALKELLGDPVSRQAIHRALADSSERRGGAWWSRAWVWGGAVAATAAVLVVVAVVHPKGAEQRSAPVEIASAPSQPPADLRVESTPEANPPAVRKESAKRQSSGTPRELPLNGRDFSRLVPLTERDAADRLKKETVSTAAPAPAAGPSAQAVQEPASAQKDQTTAELQARPMAGLASGAIGGVAGGGGGSAGVAAASGVFVAGARLAPLRYSLLKRSEQGVYAPLDSQAELKAGDLIRLDVRAAVSGRLSLFAQDASGEWKLVFPEVGDGMAIAANAEAAVPEAGIQVRDSAQKFRISLTLPVAAARAKAAVQGTPGSTAATPSAPEGAPVTLDLTIGPGRAP